MSSSLLACIIIFAGSLILYAINVIPMAMTSMITMMAFVLAGCLEPSVALSGFANSTVIIYGSMYVLAAGLNRTHFIDLLSDWIIRIAGGSMRRAWLGYVVLAAFLTSLIPSPPSAFAIVAPLCLHTCKKFNESPSKYMFALGMVCIGCCFTLPFGSAISQSLLSNSFFEIYGLGQYAMEVTDPLKARWPAMLFLCAWAYFVAPRFAPKQSVAELSTQPANEKEKPMLPIFSEIMGVVIFVLVILLMVFGGRLGIAPWQVSLAGALLMVVCGVLTEREAYAALPGSVLLTFVGALATGNALAATGAGEVVGEFLSKLLGGTTNNYIFGAVLFLMPFCLTHLMLNSGVSALVRPVILMICSAVGANPVGPTLLLLSSSLTVYGSPLATPVIPMLMEAGGYDFKSLIKQGVLPSILMALIQIVYIMTVFPAF